MECFSQLSFDSEVYTYKISSCLVQGHNFALISVDFCSTFDCSTFDCSTFDCSTLDYQYSVIGLFLLSGVFAIRRYLF